jgi:nicotinate-nucleotide--dimethylbenzimidazole phosphoribosyltransferase
MITIPKIPLLDESAMQAARQRQDQLTKPRGSLGKLEQLSIQVAGITGRLNPDLSQKAVIVMAADHGVAAAGVSAYPPDVTRQMVHNFLGGGAAINVLSRQAGARVIVVDIGVAGNLPQHPGLLHCKIAAGTQNLLEGAAMTREQTEQAIKTGMHVMKNLADEGVRLVATGEMGIGNTTASAALISVFTGKQPSIVTGRGTGLDDNGLRRKIEVIEQAIQVNQPDRNDPLDVLTKLGGLEIAGLVGVILEAASRRVPVVLDGVIAGAAALTACRLAPQIKPYLIAGHRSVEPGHTVLLESLNLEPLLGLDLRLGEGTGAVLAFHLIDAAVKTLNEMATFNEAGVSEEV